MRPYEVDFAEVARRHVRTIAAWWSRNRLAAPVLFSQELDAAIDRIARDPPRGGEYHPGPHGGPRAPTGTRRVLLRRARYHLYYTVDDSARRILIRAVWIHRGVGDRNCSLWPPTPTQSLAMNSLCVPPPAAFKEHRNFNPGVPLSRLRTARPTSAV